MSQHWTRKAVAAGLGLAGALTLGMGCGGDARDAVVRPEPGVNVSTTTNNAAPATGTPSASATSTPASTAAAAPTKSEGWGTLKGQVVFGSNAPAIEDLIKKGEAPKDPNVCAKEGPIKSERLIVDPATKGVKNVFVYIPKPTAVKEEAKAAAASAKVEFDQAGCVFKPHVLGVLSTGKLMLKSSDPGINHNVNARLKMNAQFNKILSMGSTAEVPLGAAERSPAEVTCDIHPWMKGYWLILDSPYFAVTDDKGNFEIKNAPAGTQKVVVWQEAVGKGGFVTSGSGEEIVIKADDTTTKSFTIDPTKILPAK
jgi:hypothetical protein